MLRRIIKSYADQLTDGPRRRAIRHREARKRFDAQHQSDSTRYLRELPPDAQVILRVCVGVALLVCVAIVIAQLLS